MSSGITTFTFDSVVYLAPGEYALAVLTNSSNYQLFSGSIGNDVTATNRKIAHQPSVGSCFLASNSGEYKPDPSRMIKFKLSRANFTGQTISGSNNYVNLITHANGAVGNTANVLYQTFKTTGSTINFSNTAMEFQYKSYNTSNSAVEYTDFSLDQNIILNTGRQITSSTNGMFLVNATMATTNSHISPVIDIDRMSLITIDNDIDNAGLSANDVVVVTSGAGYVNVAPSAYTATVAASETSNTATMNVHVEVTMTVNTSWGATPGGNNVTFLASANTGYIVSQSHPGAFAIGEAVRIVGTDFTESSITNPVQVDSGTESGSLPANTGYGIITRQTYVGHSASNNVASITIKTDANTSGIFKAGTLIRADETAQDLAVTGITDQSETYMAVGTVTGVVSNVFPVAIGSGYYTSPTITISTPGDEAGAFDSVGARTGGTEAVVATVFTRGEDSTSGGNINAKYVSRRVTLEDGFDAADLKVLVTAYKPIGTDVNVYYKVKSGDDPQDFDNKSYVLMSQETANSVISTNEQDVREYTYKTANDSVQYSSENITYDNFKTFAIKIVMSSDSVITIPKLRDMRAIALDA